MLAVALARLREISKCATSHGRIWGGDWEYRAIFSMIWLGSPIFYMVAPDLARLGQMCRGWGEFGKFRRYLTAFGNICMVWPDMRLSGDILMYFIKSYKFRQDLAIVGKIWRDLEYWGVICPVRPYLAKCWPRAAIFRAT